MNLTPTTTDNVTEVLVKIIDFTERRDEILRQNILAVNRDSFVPVDLDVTGFADLMAFALSEHVQNSRLVFMDNETIRFGCEGHFSTEPVADEQSQELFKNDIRKYLKEQLKKLSENTLNGKVARELLRHMQEQQAAVEQL